MLDYLQKYKELPDGIRVKISSPQATVEIDRLEKEYGVDLATIIVRVMIRDLALENLPSHFVLFFDMNSEQAKRLAEEIKTKVLFDVIDFVKPRQDSVEDKYQRLNAVQAAIADSRKIDTKTSAGFFFSPEDEEEVRMIAKKLDTEYTSGLSSKIENKLEAIIKQANVVFSSSIAAERFRQIIQTYLRGIRNKIETKQTLTKDFDSGGLGLESHVADKIIVVAAAEIDKLDEPVMVKPPAMIVPEDALEALDKHSAVSPKIDFANLQSAGMRDIEYDLARELAKKEEIKKAEKKETDKNVIGNLDLSHELAPLTPAIKPQIEKNSPISTPIVPMPPAPSVIEKILPVQPPVIRPAVDGSKVYNITPQMIKPEAGSNMQKTDIIPPAAPVPVEVNISTPVIRVSNSDTKPRMDDVKFVPFVMDPIAELRYFTLINFRRLSVDPREAVKKIKDKLTVLEEEKYARRLEGIKAWRLSPLNKMYLDLGRECIEHGVDVDALIEKKKKDGTEVMETKEFDAIMDFNRSLRF